MQRFEMMKELEDYFGTTRQMQNEYQYAKGVKMLRNIQIKYWVTLALLVFSMLFKQLSAFWNNLDLVCLDTH